MPLKYGQHTAELHVRAATTPQAGSGELSGAEALSQAEEALRSDLAPAAERIREALELEGDDFEAALAALSGDLPGMLPDSPELAAVMENAMAEAAAQELALSAAGEQRESAPDEDAEEAIEFKILNMAHCPKDGGILDKDGNCNHPNHDAAAKGADAEKEETGDSGEPDSLGYTRANRRQINQDGSWQTLGLPAFENVKPDTLEPLCSPEEARERIAAGVSMTSPLGDKYQIASKWEKHWSRKLLENQNERLKYLDEMIKTIENPHEIWEDVGRKRKVFVRVTKGADGRVTINAVTESGDVFSWHPSDWHSLNHYRKGKLLWIRA